MKKTGSSSKTEQDLARRLVLEELITAIAERFLNISAQAMGEEIYRTLRDVGGFFGSEGAFFLSSGSTAIDRMFIWKENGSLQNEPVSTTLDRIPWIKRHLSRNSVLHVPSVAQIPEEADREGALWASAEVKSFAAVPLYHHDDLIGILGIEMYSREQVWQDADMTVLRILGCSIIRAIEQHRSESLARQHAHDFKFLSETALHLADFPEDQNIFSYIGDTLSQLTAAAIVITSLSGDSISIEAVCGKEHYVEAIRDFIDSGSLDRILPLPDYIRNELRRGEIIKVPGGIYELLLGAYASEFCSALEEHHSIGEIYVTGFARKGEVFGSAVMLFARGESLRNDDIIRTFVGQASLALQRRKAEEALRESEENYRQVVEQANEYILVLQDGIVRYANPACLNAPCGFSLEELQSRHFTDFIHPDDRARIMEFHGRRLAGKQEPFIYSLRIMTSDTTYRWFESNTAPMRWKGRLASLVVLTDVTERRRAEEQNRQQLREKEVLLKEIHHRVKNNLQIISSLLSLQAGTLRDPQIQALLRDSQNRVRSMALVHEKLYQSLTLSHVNCGDYVRSIGDHLMRTYMKRGVSLHMEAEEVLLAAESAVPCGLIANELISNALKHAFPGDNEGEIRVRVWSCREAQEGRKGMTVHLEVGDNGTGLPAGVDVSELSSLGLQLVYDLVAQLEGWITVASEGGTLFSIVFFVRDSGEDSGGRCY